MSKAVLKQVRRLCMALPEVTERPSHGSPTWFVRDKKTFVTFVDNHHGDGILGIWCAAPPPILEEAYRVIAPKTLVAKLDGEA